LAWAGAGPHGAVVGETGEPQGERPSPDSGEEVTLGESHKVRWSDILDAPLVHFARRDQVSGNQFS
jgi:hypothetical protein